LERLKLIEQVENGQSSFKKQSLFELGHAAHEWIEKDRGKKDRGNNKKEKRNFGASKVDRAS